MGTKTDPCCSGPAVIWESTVCGEHRSLDSLQHRINGQELCMISPGGKMVADTAGDASGVVTSNTSLRNGLDSDLSLLMPDISQAVFH